MHIYLIGRKSLINELNRNIPYLNIPIERLKNRSDYLRIIPSRSNIYLVWQQFFQTQTGLCRLCKKIRSIDAYGNIIVLSKRYSNVEAMKLYATCTMVLDYISLNTSKAHIYDRLSKTIHSIIKSCL